MHFALGHHTRAAMTAISLLGMLWPVGQASAAPVAQQDATAQMAGVVDVPEVALDSAAFSVDDGDGLQGAAIQASGTTPERVTRIERAPKPASQTVPTKLESQNPVAHHPSTSTHTKPDLSAEIRSTLKESVRPLHDQLVESGALEAWSDLKADLGLSKHKWGNASASEGDPNLPGRLDPSQSAAWQDPANRPKTGPPTEVDRELAAQMLEKLIDEIKPWVLSLGGLYLLGYLIKAGYDRSQRKAIRRHQHETALVRRRSTRKAKSTKPDS